MASEDHAYEHRCCWNCGADNSHVSEEEPPAGIVEGRGMWEPMVFCYEPTCPDPEMFGDYASPLFKESEWHDIAARCPAWKSAEGIFPSTLIVPTGLQKSSKEGSE